jgi:hypothetical protein
MLFTRRAFVRLTGGLALAALGLALRPGTLAVDLEQRSGGCDLPPEPAIYPPIVWEIAPDAIGRGLPAEPAIEPPLVWEAPYDPAMSLLPAEPAILPALVWEQAGCGAAGQGG